MIGTAQPSVTAHRQGGAWQLCVAHPAVCQLYNAYERAEKIAEALAHLINPTASASTSTAASPTLVWS